VLRGGADAPPTSLRRTLCDMLRNTALLVLVALFTLSPTPVRAAISAASCAAGDDGPSGCCCAAARARHATSDLLFSASVTHVERALCCMSNNDRAVRTHIGATALETSPRDAAMDPGFAIVPRHNPWIEPGSRLAHPGAGQGPPLAAPPLFCVHCSWLI